MITVENEFEVAEDKNLYDVEPGEAFVGTVADSDGDDWTGLFVRTKDSVVYVEDPSVGFDAVEDDNYSPLTVKNFKLADVTVTVTEVY